MAKEQESLPLALKNKDFLEHILSLALTKEEVLKLRLINKIFKETTDKLIQDSYNNITQGREIYNYPFTQDSPFVLLAIDRLVKETIKNNNKNKEKVLIWNLSFLPLPNNLIHYLKTQKDNILCELLIHAYYNRINKIQELLPKFIESLTEGQKKLLSDYKGKVSNRRPLTAIAGQYQLHALLTKADPNEQDARKLQDLLKRGVLFKLANIQEALSPLKEILQVQQGKNRGLFLATMLDRINQVLQQGAQINNNAQGNNGDTTLIRAANLGRIETALALLDKGADVNAQNNYGDTALYWAAAYGHTAIVQGLLDKGADVNAQNDYGDTALHTAAANGNIQVLQELLRRDADLNIQNEEGKAPSDIAKEKGIDLNQFTKHTEENTQELSNEFRNKEDSKKENNNKGQERDSR